MDKQLANNPVTCDPWAILRNATSARIALGRSGSSLPTREWLDFKSAHVAARDAVHFPFDGNQLATELRELNSDVVLASSEVANRRMYLERPDLGRALDSQSRSMLQQLRTDSPIDLAVVVSDGLSALAVHQHARPVLQALLPQLRADAWRLAPIVVARFGRVAIQDEVGDLLGAELAIILIGERPGLGSPDSLSAYVVYGPRVGNTDANRNCVSNIRQSGLQYGAAAETIFYLLTEARRRHLSGVLLKDRRSIGDSKPFIS